MILIALFPQSFAKLGDFIFNHFVSISSWFSDYFYTNVSRDNATIQLVFILFSICINALTFCYLSFTWKFDDKLKSLEKRIIELKKLIFKEKENEVKKESIADPANEIRKIDRTTKILRRSYLIFNLAMLLFIILISLAVAFYSTMDRLNEKFKKDLIVLSDYLGDKEIHHMKAGWALMRSKKNYDQILSKLDEYRKQYNISKLESLES